MKETIGAEDSANRHARLDQSDSVSARSVAASVLAIEAHAVGALAFGALAIGALAIGRLTIRRLAIGNAGFRSRKLDDLQVKRLRAGKLEQPDASLKEPEPK